MFGSEDHLMNLEIRELMSSHDGKKAQAVIQDLIQKQEYKKVEKELSDWKDDDIKKLDDSVTFTFDQEERDADYLSLEEIEEADDIDEREKNETIYVDLNYDDDDDEEDSDNVDTENNKIQSNILDTNLNGMISMADDFNNEDQEEITRRKVVITKKTKADVPPNQKDLLSFWKKK